MSDAISPPSIDIPTCCGSERKPTVGTKFHFSLNVRNLEQSVAFYRILFNRPPAKHYPDYAKFELEQPPLVFSLVPNPPASAGALSHFGFPVASTDEVNAAAQRLSAAGLKISCQQGTVCGYARQDKVWVADPDHNHWEVYVVHEDIDPETVRSGFDGVTPQAVVQVEQPARMEAVIWEHRVMQPIPSRIPHHDNSVDEIRLEGTFNSEATREQRSHLLTEVCRVLKPGGKVTVHGLVSDQPLASLPTLPGVASLVKQVPTEAEPLRELQAAGLENLRVTKLPESSVFRSGTIEMREIKLEGLKPMPSENSHSTRRIIYKGPFAEVKDDAGQIFPRGIRTEVSAATWDRLSRSAAAKQFLFLGSESLDEQSCAT